MRTVIVVGAGASKDFDASGRMPVGSELAVSIERILDSEIVSRSDSGPIATALARNGGFGDIQRAAMARIRDGIQSQDSIDDFLAEWSDFEDVERVAKLCIAHLILDAERESELGRIARMTANQAVALRNLQGSWLGVLGRRLNPGVRRRDITHVYANVTFVTFNYDRCIEQYLLSTFQSTFNLPREAALEAVDRIPILHAYGSLGHIGLATPTVEFGANDWSLGQAASGIKTYMEQLDKSRLIAIQSAVGQAERIVFLGCAYHAQNVDVLFGSARERVNATILVVLA
jgi:hypothetical protein